MKVIAIPRNGLGNRLQMLASSFIFSESMNSELEIVWTTQPVFPSGFNSILERIDGLPVIELSDFSMEDFPDFTKKNQITNEITLKNLRAGDQLFMPKLVKLLRRMTGTRQIVIISGEKFLLNKGKYFKDSNEFRSKRREFYKKLEFSNEVNKYLEEIQTQLGDDYWAIHLRETDRKKEAIGVDKVLESIVRQDDFEIMRTKRVYIASDEQKRGLDLADKLRKIGFSPLYLANLNRDRLSEKESVFSMLDWILLSRATRIVSYGSTTFSYEAAVAGGTFENRIHISQSISKRILSSMKLELLNLKLYGKIPYSTYFLWNWKK